MVNELRSPKMNAVKITAEPVRINGERRWHFVAMGSKSLRTWVNKRDAIKAGEREFQWVKVG
jgi:hypothetical protein